MKEKKNFLLGTFVWFIFLFFFKGVVYGVLSSFFVALNAVIVKRTLAEVVDESSDKLILYNNLNAALILPFIIFFLTVTFFFVPIS